MVTLYSMRIPLIKASSSNLPPEQAKLLAWLLGLLTKVHATPGPFVLSVSNSFASHSDRYATLRYEVY